MSIYFVVFGVLARYIFLAFPAGVVLWLLPTVWVGIDWIRGILFTGLPWMDLGYGLWEKIHVIQIADLFGHHGVTWMIVFINSFLAIFLTKRQTLANAFFLVLSFVLVLGSGAVYSKQRIAEITSALSAYNIKK
jgi:apolipoprotein N-acyltransferase